MFIGITELDFHTDGQSAGVKFDLIQIPKKCLKSETVKLFTHL